MKFVIAFVATLACAAASYAPYYPAPVYPYAGAYAGAYAPAADIKVLPSGFLADTPEVAAAKVAHFAEVAKAASSAAYAPAPYAYGPAPYAAPYYAGAYAHSVADIKVLPSGFLADTPEVAHAKAAHLAEKAKVASKAAYYAPAPYAAPAYAPYAAPAYAPYAAPYHGSHY
uniref:Cuticle protein n=1 Tax=Cacopsylla melanoneura TaxID=428564 RepID=A0A8D9A1Y9_9HEMI